MSEPRIVFNADTGSDTQASGAPAIMAAIHGANASVTSGNATINLATDAPDLTNVPTDGTAAIWISVGDPTTQRNAFTITGKDVAAYTVTVSPAPGVTGTFVWAIGGKRRTWDHAQSRGIFRWTTYTKITETDQTITSTMSISGLVTGTDPGPFPNRYIGSDDNSIIRTISWNTDSVLFTVATDSTTTDFYALRFTNTAATKTGAWIANELGNNKYFRFFNCIVGDSVHTVRGIAFRLVAYSSIFQYCVADGANTSWASVPWHGCIFRYNAGAGIFLSANAMLQDCLFYKNARGLSWSGVLGHIRNCTIVDNSSHGIDITATTGSAILLGNVIAFNGGYGIRKTGSLSNVMYQIRPPIFGYNCFWNNTSGARLNFPELQGDISVDPQFADRSAEDYRVGINLRAKGYPSPNDGQWGMGGINPVQGVLSKTYIDIGGLQRQEPEGGALFRPPLAGAIW